MITKAKRCLLYFRYLKCVNEISVILEEIQHPQRRRCVQDILENSMGRILELKSEIVTTVYSECPNVSEEALKNQFLMEDLDLIIPKYFGEARDADAKETRTVFDSVISRYGDIPQETPGGEGIHLTLEDAVLLIQIHERARQGQSRARLMRDLKLKKDEIAAEASRATKRHYNIAATFVTQMEAASVIQKVWRGYRTRQRVKMHRKVEQRILGMSEGAEVANDERVRRWKERGKQVHEDMTQELENLVSKTRMKLEGQTEDYLEKMLDDKREWYTNYLTNDGVLPEFEISESGGQLAEKDNEIVDDFIGDELDKKTAKIGSKSAKKKDTKSKKSGGMVKKAVYKPFQKPGDADQEEKIAPPKPKPSRFVDFLKIQIKQFQEIWGNDLVDQTNFELNSREIEKNEFTNFEEDLKEQCNAIITNDLEILRQAMEKDKGKKGKKSKQSKKTKRGPKKGKKEKDLTPDRTLESLVEELVQQEIIKEFPNVDNEVFIYDKVGSHDFIAEGFVENPSYYDIQQTLKEIATLPLGSEIIRKKSPLVRSILLTGPRGNGKRLLLKGVCKATSAVCFDLSATNIAGKYQGKAGLNMLMHLVNKVSRLVQPAIIFIDEAEKTFIKKIPKSDRTDPRRLKKDLPKLVRGITSDDRIVIFGVSDFPFESDQKSICSTYQKIIYVPRPDYGHRKLLWKEAIIRNHGEVTSELDSSTLTKLSDGYSSKVICQVVKQVLTTRRVSQMSRYPLTLSDFVNALNQYDPIYKKEEDMFQNWLSKTPMGKKRLKLFKKQNVAQMNEQISLAKNEEITPIRVVHTEQ